MPKGAELILKILVDASKAKAGLDEATSGLGKFQSGMGKLVAPAAAVAGGVAAIGVATVNAASDVQQSFGAIDSVFGKNADQVKEWAQGAATAVGLSSAKYGEFASTIGAQLKNLGVPMDSVAGSTDELIRLGSDLAATYGGTTEEAVSALSSALRGEADPAERYGLALSTTAVNAELAAKGLDGLTGPAASAAKAQAVMALATEQAGGALGQFERESDTVAGQTQTMKAQFTDASAALGEALLPMVAAAAGALADMAGWVKQNSAWLTPLIVAVGALAAAILLINGAMAAYVVIQKAMKIATAISTAAQWAWNAAMAANPIGIIILAVVALVGAFIYLWNTNEDFRNFFINMWKNIARFFTDVWKGAMQVVGNVVKWFQTVWQIAMAIFVGLIKANVRMFTDLWNGAVKGVTAIVKTLQKVFDSVFKAIMVPIQWVIDAFNNVVSAIKSVISWLGKIKIPDVFGAIGDFLGGRSVSVAATTTGVAQLSSYQGPSPTALGGSRSRVGSSVVINVQGGLDSADAIARRVQQVLDSRSHRISGVTMKRRTA